MNIDEFKLLTKQQLIEYGKTIKLGNTYDSNKNLLTYKDSNGYWYEYTYDSNNNELSYKESNGYWSERTYDDNKNELTFKNSYGYNYVQTFDSNNNRLTHKDLYGYNYKLLCIGQDFNLMYDKNKKLYRAGCKMLNYTKSIKFFNTEGKDYIDAELFMKTIHQNELDIVT